MCHLSGVPPTPFPLAHSKILQQRFRQGKETCEKDIYNENKEGEEIARKDKPFVLSESMLDKRKS